MQIKEINGMRAPFHPIITTTGMKERNSNYTAIMTTSRKQERNTPHLKLWHTGHTNTNALYIYIYSRS
jgi:hypothetical protein